MRRIIMIHVISSTLAAGPSVSSSGAGSRDAIAASIAARNVPVASAAALSAASAWRRVVRAHTYTHYFYTAYPLGMRRRHAPGTEG